MIEVFGLLLALFSTPAQAQCTGTFGPQTVCGNPTGAAGQGKPAAISSFSGTPGGGGSTAANLTRAQISSTNLSAQTVITLNGYATANDLGYGATYTSSGASCPNGIGAIQDLVGTCFNLVITDFVNPGWFGAKADGGATQISSGDISANTQWKGTYTAGQTWDYVGTQEAVYAAFAPTSTPGSIQWNAVNTTNNLNKQLFVPTGTYGVNATVLAVIQGFTIRFASRLSTIYTWTGAAPGTTWLFNSADYGLLENFGAQCTEAQSFGSAVPCVSLDNNASPGGLRTQQLTFINSVIIVGQNGQGLAINPVSSSSGQGDTINFINPYFAGDFNSSDWAMLIKGANALQVGIFGGDMQGFPHDGMQILGGSVVAYNFHSENQNNTLSTPLTTQFTTYGSDFDIGGQANGSGYTVVSGYRAEDNILSSSTGVTFTQLTAGISLSNASALGVDIKTWGNGQNYSQGTVVNGGTKNRPFMMVDSSGTAWSAITGGSGTLTVQDSNAAYSVNQWAGFYIALRFGSNGFTNNCLIDSNTATTITYSGCSALSTQSMYQIVGLTGGSAPSWDSADPGFQAPFGGVGQGFTTTASSTCVGVGSSIFSNINVNDYIVIPDADSVAPAGFSIYRMPLYAKVTAKNSGACGGGSTADNLTVSKAAGATITNGPGYFGTPITDNNDSWIELPYDTVQGSNLLDNVNIGIGLIGGNPVTHNVLFLSKGSWFDTTFAGSYSGSNIEQEFNLTYGATSEAPCTALTPAGTIDITLPLTVCNVLALTPAGNETINAPVPPAGNSTSQEFTLHLIRSGGPFLITFGSNFSSVGPLLINSTIGDNYLVKFRSYNSVWREIARSPSPTASGTSIVASPAGPNSTSVFTMQGLAGAITPSKTGNINIQICGTIIETGVTAAGTGIQYQLSYGTSTAPTTNAALAGTQVGTVQEYMLAQTVTAADVFVPMCQTAIVTGLTVGTAYWVDLAAKAITGTGFALSNVNIAAHEF